MLPKRINVFAGSWKMHEVLLNITLPEPKMFRSQSCFGFSGHLLSYIRADLLPWDLRLTTPIVQEGSHPLCQSIYHNIRLELFSPWRNAGSANLGKAFALVVSALVVRRVTSMRKRTVWQLLHRQPMWEKSPGESFGHHWCRNVDHFYVQNGFNVRLLMGYNSPWIFHSFNFLMSIFKTNPGKN